MKVAIVGMGVSGISVLHEIVRHPSYNQSWGIDVYDQSIHFGTGLPYQLDHPSLRLNQTAETMSLYFDRPDDFMDWAKNTTGQDIQKGEHLPRFLYGEYLKDRLEQLLQISNARVFLERVEDIHIGKQQKFLLGTKSGEKSMMLSIFVPVIFHTKILTSYRGKNILFMSLIQ